MKGLMKEQSMPQGAKQMDEGDSGFHLRDYLPILRTRWRLAVFIFVLVFASSAFLSRMMTPYYESTIQFEILSPNEIVTPAKGAENPIFATITRSYMQTQFELLMARRNLQAVVSRLDLMREWGMNEARAIERLEKLIEVNPLRGTNLVDVTVMSPDAELSQRICEAMAACYAQLRVEKENELIQTAIASRFEVLKTRKAELESKADTVRDYIRNGKYLSPGIWDGARSTPKDSNLVQESVNQCNERKNVMAAAISAMEVHLAELQKLKDEEMLSYVTRSGLLSAESYSSERVRVLSEQLKQERLDRTKLLMSGYAEKHPHIKIADKQIANTQAQVYQELEGMREAMVKQLGIRKAELKAVEAELAIAKEQLKAKMLEDQKLEIAVESYMAEKERYETLENEYIADKMRILTAPEMIDITSLPELATRPSSPNHHLNLAIGAMVGLMAGLGTILLCHYLDNSIKSLDEAERKLGQPVLGIIPNEFEIAQTPETLWNSPHGEAYRMLRTNMNIQLMDLAHKVIAVTSAHSGDGKTTTIVNLGYAFAQSRERTLIIDADMRRPSLAKRSQQSNERGLSQYLSQGDDWRDYVIALDEPNLFLLPAGQIPQDPAGLLGGPQMERLLEECSREYQLTLIDTTPILGLSDASIVVSKVPRTLFVLQPKRLPLKIVQRALMQIEQSGGQLMGLVLNKIETAQDSTYQYYTNYASYYQQRGASLGQQDTLPTKIYDEKETNK